MELAISSWGLRDHINKDWPACQMIDEVYARYGVTQIELCQMHFERQDAGYLSQIVSHLQKVGGRCVNMPIDTGNISNINDAARMHDLKIIESWFHVAAFIGCPMVRVNTGGAPDAGALDRVVDSYKRLADVAESLGLQLVLENHGGLSSDPAHVLSLVERVGRGRLGLCPDFGNYPEEQRYDAIAAMMPYACIVHAKYNQPGSNGPQWDWPRCVRIVKESGFKGPVSIEIGRLVDAWDAIEEAMKLWQQVWNEVA